MKTSGYRDATKSRHRDRVPGGRQWRMKKLGSDVVVALLPPLLSLEADAVIVWGLILRWGNGLLC